MTDRAVRPLTYDDGVELCVNIIKDFQTGISKKAPADKNIEAITEFMDGMISTMRLMAEVKKVENRK